MKILIPLDDSKFAERNVEYVKNMAKKMDAELLLLHIVALPPSAPGNIDLEPLEKNGKEFLEKHKKQLESEGVKVSIKVVVGFGRVGQIIIDEAQKENADLIALGAKGKSLMRNILIGSVADHVTRNAACSVLVIR